MLFFRHFIFQIVIQYTRICVDNSRCARIYSNFVNKMCVCTHIHTHSATQMAEFILPLRIYLSTSIAFLSFRIQTVARRYSRFCFFFLSLFFSLFVHSLGCSCFNIATLFVCGFCCHCYCYCYDISISALRCSLASLYFESIYHLIYKVTVWFSNLFFFQENGIARRNNWARKKNTAVTISTSEQREKNCILSTHIMKRKNIYFASEKKRVYFDDKPK